MTYVDCPVAPQYRMAVARIDRVIDESPAARVPYGVTLLMGDPAVYKQSNVTLCTLVTRAEDPREYRYQRWTQYLYLGGVDDFPGFA